MTVSIAGFAEKTAAAVNGVLAFRQQLIPIRIQVETNSLVLSDAGFVAHSL